MLSHTLSPDRPGRSFLADRAYAFQAMIIVMAVNIQFSFDFLINQL